MRFRGTFAYIDAHLPDGETLPLMRLRYAGSAGRWGFALYLAGKDGYQTKSGDRLHRRHPEEALDQTCRADHSASGCVTREPQATLPQRRGPLGIFYQLLPLDLPRLTRLP